jgi:hypothetical protein
MSNITKTMHQSLSAPLILGRYGFELFSAVEGIYLTVQEKKMFADMDRKQLSNDERRALIVAKYLEKA